MTTQRLRIIAAVSIAVILLAAGGTWYAFAATSQGQGTRAATGKQVYRCPMHPDQVSDRDGKCPICGMGLVPASADEPPVSSSCGAGPGGGCCGGADAPAAPSK